MSRAALPADPPLVVCTGDTYRLRWPTLSLEMEMSRVYEHREAVNAELLIATVSEDGVRPLRKLIYRAAFNLTAGETRGRLAKQLAERREDVPWVELLEQACFLVLERYRTGEPTIYLPDVDPSERPRWFLRPYLEYGGPTILFAPGGAGKSYLALCAGVSIASGTALFGEPVGTPGPVLYLDWETDQYTHAERLRAIARGGRLATLPPIYYRFMYSSLMEQLPVIQREVERLGVVAVIVDSLMAARGGEPESADVTTRIMGCVRALRRPALLIDHVSKAAMQATERKGRLSPFGSVASENRARNTWSVQRIGEEEADEFDVALIHEKTNNGRYEPRHAYHLAFTNRVDADGEKCEAFRIARCEIGDIPELEAELPLPKRILAYLQRQPEAWAETEGIAAGLAMTTKDVAPALSRLKRDGKLIYLKDRHGYGVASQQSRAEAIS